MSIIASKYVFAHSMHSSYILLNSNKFIVLKYTLHLKSLKSYPLQLNCVLRPSNHSNEALFKSNVYFQPQTT